MTMIVQIYYISFGGNIILVNFAEVSRIRNVQFAPFSNRYEVLEESIKDSQVYRRAS
jgi:hypothetical protein